MAMLKFGELDFNQEVIQYFRELKSQTRCELTVKDSESAFRNDFTLKEGARDTAEDALRPFVTTVFTNGKPYCAKVFIFIQSFYI